MPAGPDIWITFEGGKVSGDGGCNAFGGAYVDDPSDGALRIGELASTKRACVDPVRNDLEAASSRRCAESPRPASMATGASF